MKDTLLELAVLFWPWIILLGIVLVFSWLFSWARNKKTGALVFGILVQMIMPDPYAERTVEIVQEDKKETKKQQDENGDGDQLDEKADG